MIDPFGRIRDRDGAPVRWMPIVRDAVAGAFGLLFPSECAGCGEPDRALCIDCRGMLSVAGRHRGSLHRQSLADGTVVFSALPYEGGVRAGILAFKERGRTDAAGPLSLALKLAIEAAAAHAALPVEVCPIPATRQAIRRRGYRPVDVLLRRAGFRPASVLAVTTSTIQQKSLGQLARQRNVRNSFRAKVPLHGRRFLLVDDIVTTGATLADAARAVSAAGGEVVSAATLAFTPRRRPEEAPRATAA